jgi:hydroxymethylpyrimidine/phosphomethylpyrimidine kinase
MLFSSAITANLALGHPLEKSITIAKKFITHGLREAPGIGNGPGPIHHKTGGEHVAIA